MKEKVSYNNAVKEIEAIISEIENETIDVDVLTGKVKRAIELIKICKKKLRDTEEDLETVLKEFEGGQEVKEQSKSKEINNGLFQD